MLISKLVIENYKSFNKITITDFNEVKAIIGINGVGKSNLLSLISLFSVAINKSFTDYLFLNNKLSLDLLPFNDISKTIKVDFVLSNDNLKELYNYSVSIKHRNNKEFDIDLENITDFLSSKTSQYSNKSAKKSSLKICSQDKVEQDIKNYLANIAYYNSYNNNLFWFPKIVNYSDLEHIVNNNSKNIYCVLLHIFNRFPNIYKEIIALVKHLNPLIKSIELNIEQNSILIKQKHSKLECSLYRMSDGFIRFFILLTLLKLPSDLRPNLLLLEEPEIGLNPFLVDILGDLINSYSQSSQVIFTTHSPLLLNKMEVSGVRVFNINEQSSQLSLYSINEAKISDWLENYKLGDLWLMNILGASVLI